MTSTPGARRDEHLLTLPGTRWVIWRQSVLRGAGFPAEGVTALADPELAAAADRANREPDAVDDYRRVHREAGDRLSAQIRRIAADPLFREAVAWQNRRLIPECLDKAVAGEPRNARGRAHELTIANHWQRYCVKNDTIGFFGPVCWASLHTGAEALRVRPGPRLLARRTTYFETWAVDQVALTLTDDPAMVPWLVPRLVSSHDLVGRTLYRSSLPPEILTEPEADLLGLCDGTRTAREIADEVLWAGHPEFDTEESVLAVLVDFRERGFLQLDLTGPITAHPELDLLDKLKRIGDPDVRERALSTLTRFIEAKDAVAATAGDPAALVPALGRASEIFEEITGAAASRRAGETYAGRMIVYEDTARDAQVEFGAPVVEALAAPLGMLLDSARWFVAEAARAYRHVFEDAYEKVRRRLGGGSSVPLAAVVAAATPQLFLSPRESPRPVAEIRRELQRRWAEILAPPEGVRRHTVRAADIAGRVRESFDAPEPAWAAAVHHSPDVMIAAEGPEAMARGDFLAVVGEVHLAANTVESRVFVVQHDDPSWCLRMDERDHGDRRIYLASPKHWRAVSSRTAPPSALLSPQYTYWALHPDSGGTPNPPIPAARLAVHREGGRLGVRSRDGREYDFMEVVGELLSGAVINGFSLLPPAAHQPRVAIDKMVVARESWSLDAMEVSWAVRKDEAERFRAARAWRAELGLPERIFYRVPVEDKPVFVDFRSLVLVNGFAKAIRLTRKAKTTRFTVTEMLPDIHHTWLTDAEGARYTAELRVIAVDPAAASRRSPAPER